MRDENGREFHVGCIINCNGSFRRVLDIKDNLVLMTTPKLTIEKARNSLEIGLFWDWSFVITKNWKIANGRPLGVFDENGKENKVGDKFVYAD